MEEAAFLKMDIFFAVTTAAVVLLTLAVGVVMYLIARVLADVRQITRMLREETEKTAEDFDAVRADIREGVHQMRERITESAAVVGAARKLVKGAGLVGAISGLFDALGAARSGEGPRTRRKGKRSE